MTVTHLLTLYSIFRGIQAKNILEIGGKLITCDTRDFSYLLNEIEKRITTFIHGKLDHTWPLIEKSGGDFAFLDYFSSERIFHTLVKKEIEKCISYMKTNGIVAVQDSKVEEYKLKEVLKNIRTKFRVLHNFNIEVMSLPYNYGWDLSE